MSDFDTPIYISKIDAEKYQLFLKHFDMFKMLLQPEVLDIKGGKIIMHFDGQGTFKGIQIEKWIKPC